MPVSFAKDIKPMFNDDDIACMDGMGVKLDDYTYMSAPAGDETFPDHAAARHVLARLKGSERPRMPMGGPYWSPARTDTLQQWMDDGFQA
jgi:hypothetical protein